MTASTGPKTSSRAIRIGLDAAEDRRLDEVAVAPGARAAALTSLAPSSSRAPRSQPSTCSRCASNATGPISVSGSRGSPSRIARARAASRSTNSSWTVALDDSREPAMHVCPVAAKMPATTPLAAASRSASANTMCGDLPPSSKDTRARCAAAPLITAVPVAVEPVKATLSTPGMRDQRRAGVLAEAGDDVEDAGREAGLLDEARRTRASKRAPARPA